MKYENRAYSANRGYGNIAVYSPDDILMFYANEHKMRFYIKNSLAEKIAEDKYRLTFTPNGLGYSQDNNVFGNPNCLIPRENKCVVSGDEDLNLLSKHHIVPRFFRIHFPIEFKSSFQTIVLIRRDIHSEYTMHEQNFYDVLAEKYGVPRYSTFAYNPSKRENKISRTLFLYGHLMPQDARTELELEFQHKTGLEPTKENLAKIVNTIIEDKRTKTSENDFGAAIAAKITDYREFEMLWLNHFIEYAKPKYLPEDLIKTYNLELV